MASWSILVLGAVRLGCDRDDDRLQNHAAEHRSLRRILGIDGWCDDQTCDGRCRRDTICLLSPDTIERLNQLILAAGPRLVPEAAATVRCDWFGVASDGHYPTDSSRIGDGRRPLVPTAQRRAGLRGVAGWRPHGHLLHAVTKHRHALNRNAASTGRDSRKRLQDADRAVHAMADRILGRATEWLDPAWFPISPGPATRTIAWLRTTWLAVVDRTIPAWDQARRRGRAAESVPHDETRFRRCEPQTPLLTRGTVPQPVAFGHRVLVIEDGAGLVGPDAILPHGAEDGDVVVEPMRPVQRRWGGRLRRASFARGVPSPEHQRGWAAVVSQPCLPVTGHVPAAPQEREATVEFGRARRRHPGVASALGALPSGHGLERCRDRSFGGSCRVVGLGMLGRNLPVLGKRLIAREDPTSEAGRSRRGRSAA